jgi:hypothetical protein
LGLFLICLCRWSDLLVFRVYFDPALVGRADAEAAFANAISTLQLVSQLPAVSFLPVDGLALRSADSAETGSQRGVLAVHMLLFSPTAASNAFNSTQAALDSDEDA